MHLCVQEAFDRARIKRAYDVEIPKCHWYTDANSEWWDSNQNRFPDTPLDRKKREVFCLERIFPVPKIVREKLIDLYCPPQAQAAARVNPNNKDCLIRVYLGRRRQPNESSTYVSFTLRNFRLYLDQLQDIGLEVHDIARAMADALALLHLSAKIDGYDIELVLGSTPTKDQAIRSTLPSSYVKDLEPGTSTYQKVMHEETDFKNRVIRLWMIDFDRCNSIKMDDAGVELAVKAFMDNSHYFPRPIKDDKFAWAVWTTFQLRYIETGMKYNSGFPVRFIDGVVKAFDARIAHNTPSSGTRQPGGSNTPASSTRPGGSGITPSSSTRQPGGSGITPRSSTRQPGGSGGTPTPSTRQPGHSGQGSVRGSINSPRKTGDSAKREAMNRLDWRK